MRFFRHTVMGGVFVALLYAFAFIYFLSSSDNPLLKETASDSLESMKQKRLLVTKQFLFEDRAEMWVKSKESTLQFENHELVEKMKGVKGTCFVYNFEADNADFMSRKAYVEASNVRLKKFQGRKVIMEGRCRRLNFFLFDHPFRFNAQDFHGEYK